MVSDSICKYEFMKGFIKLCDDAYKKGWHERNGGNLSYRIKPEEINEVRELFNISSEFKPIGISVENLSGEFFLITGSTKYFKNVLENPKENIAIIEIDSKGSSYRILWGLEKGGVPTSELPTHLLNHSTKMTVTNGKHRVIMHSHPANIIALTFVLPLDDKTFTREIWEMITECPIVFPDGIGVVPWMVPGGSEIAYRTAELIKRYDIVLWAHHGIFCSGEDFDLTFGLMDTVEKAAEILIKVLSCGGKRQRILPQEIASLAKPYNVNINIDMLDLYN